MSPATLETYLRQLLESHHAPRVTVAWQGGEPTLLKVEFFRRAVELVEKHRRPGQSVDYTFQTNGILLDDEWCAFFKQHDFLVGLSVDGPRELHDAYRVDRRGRGTFDRVMQGWRHLRDPNAAVAYLNKAVVNGGRDELRHGHRVTRSLLRMTPRSEALPSAEHDAVEHDEADRLWQAVCALPPRQRQVLVLRYYLDQSEAEIAETLEVSRGSVKRHASRGLAALARCLETAP